jgi:hypothetical protein
VYALPSCSAALPSTRLFRCPARSRSPKRRPAGRSRRSTGFRLDYGRHNVLALRLPSIAGKRVPPSDRRRTSLAERTESPQTPIPGASTHRHRYFGVRADGRLRANWLARPTVCNWPLGVGQPKIAIRHDRRSSQRRTSPRPRRIAPPGFRDLMTAARLDALRGRSPIVRLGGPRAAREIAVVPPLARQDCLPKPLHDLNHEPDASNPHAHPPSPYDFSALAPPAHHAPTRPDAISYPDSARGVSTASASRARARRRSIAATRTTIPSASCQYIPSGPARTNSKSRNPYGLANPTFARFIFGAPLSR